MSESNRYLMEDPSNEGNAGGDGVDRRGFLKCMAWAGIGLVWTMSGGIPASRVFAKNTGKNVGKGADFTFVQISDSHIGFNKPANPDVTATLQIAINKINAMPHKPDFIIHTGDLSQRSKPSEFDTLDQALKGASAQQIYFVPGEHDGAKRQRRGISRALRERHKRCGILQLRSQEGAFRRSRECGQLESRRHGLSRAGTARVA
jgi:predicted MPP superfamily phosphohydrolase